MRACCEHCRVKHARVLGANMLDTIFAAIKAEAKAWQEEAAQRRTLTSVDAAADALDSCAEKLLKEVHILETESEWLTPEQYGAQHIPHVSGQTVRNWIRRGELSAEDTPRGYRIARRAQRARHDRRRRSAA